MKKLISLVGAGAMLLSLATPAFARYYHRTQSSNDVAIVLNGASATANTGGNYQNNEAYSSDGEAEVEENSGDRTMTTGDADADATAVVIANTHVECCPTSNPCRRSRCQRKECECPHNDVAVVGNGALADANTGRNDQSDIADSSGNDEAEVEENSGNRTLRTGAASSDADAWVVVNTHWAR